MRILILNWKDIKNPEVGGAEIIVYELAKRLVRKGHEVTWFCRSFEGGRQSELIDGIKIVRYGSILSMYLLAPLFYWSTNPKPDLVLDMSNTIYWQTPLWAFKSKKIAYLNQFAKEVFFYEYPPIISHFGYLVEKLQYLTYRNTPFICYSEGTKKDLIAEGVPKESIYTFPLGLDHSRYVPGTKSKDPLFLCASRLVRMKRTDLAIVAIDIVRKKYPEVKLAISGSGYERERLERLRNDLGLKENVIFLDKDIWFFEKSEGDRKVAMMQKAWALIFPSVKEGWGMTVTECASCGTPTIATRVSGLEDSVIDGETGILISKDPSPKELAEAMQRIIEDKPFREKLGENALKFSKNFSWDKSFASFYNLLTKIVSMDILK